MTMSLTRVHCREDVADQSMKLWGCWNVSIPTADAAFNGCSQPHANLYWLVRNDKTCAGRVDRRACKLQFQQLGDMGAILLTSAFVAVIAVQTLAAYVLTSRFFRYDQVGVRPYLAQGAVVVGVMSSCGWQR